MIFYFYILRVLLPYCVNLRVCRACYASVIAVSLISTCDFNSLAVNSEPRSVHVVSVNQACSFCIISFETSE